MQERPQDFATALLVIWAKAGESTTLDRGGALR